MGEFEKKIVDLIEEEGHEALILSQMSHTCQRSVRFDDWIYIRIYHDGYHFFPKHMLFNVKDDPQERYNMSEAHPEIVRQGESYLFEWQDQMMSKKETKIDPMWEIIRDGGPFHAKNKLLRYCQYLLKTGRSHYIDQYQELYPEAFR